ncbi:MAG: hypothetical protein ABI306_06625 [Caulobacteraceae bacterium]
MNKTILFASAVAAAMAAFAVVAQTDDAAKAEHNQTQTPSTVPDTSTGTVRAGAVATAPVVAAPGQVPAGEGMPGKARHNQRQTPTTVPGATNTPRAGAAATAPVVNPGDTSTPH